MRFLNKKYFTFIFAALVLLGNINFAYSQTMCNMSMQKGCQCEETEQGNTQASFSKVDCCKQVLKEINNTSDLKSIQKETISELIFLSVLPAETVNISDYIFAKKIQDPFHIPPKDLPILNCTFRI